MSQQIAWPDLPDALGLRGREVVSFVGGGGKTSALFALASSRPGTCVVTTTTKMGVDRTGGLPVLLGPTHTDVQHRLRTDRSVIVWSGSDGRRAFGVEPSDCDRWSEFADTVAVEADGSRRRPFKAPAAYEPVVPSSTTMLVGCVGLAAIGAPIVDGCHRPDRVAALTGAHVDDVLTPEHVATVLLHPDGSQKNRPAGARFAVLLNRATPGNTDVAAEIRSRIDEGRIDGGVPDVVVVTIPDVSPAELPDAS